MILLDILGAALSWDWDLMSEKLQLPYITSMATCAL
jgi:hypothetical protein